MRKYRLIALDLDGTLVGVNGEVSVENRQWIAAAQQSGCRVVLSTGRPVRSARPIAQLLELDGPLIINNGSEIWQTPDQLLLRKELDPALVRRLVGYTVKHGGDLTYWAHTVSGKITPHNIPDDYESIQWLQFGIKSSDMSLLKRIYGELKAWQAFEISNSSPYNIEFNPVGVNKGSGLAEVCRLLNIPLSETIAAGDSLNDISMIRTAGLGVAMGNAQEPVKQAAALTAPTNLEHGVAWIIREHMLA